MQLHTLMSAMMDYTEVVIVKGLESRVSGDAQMILDNYDHLGYNVISTVDMGYHIEVEISSRKNNIDEQKIVTVQELIKLARTSGKPSRYEIVNENLERLMIGLTSPLKTGWHDEEEADFSPYANSIVKGIVITDFGISVKVEG